MPSIALTSGEPAGIGPDLCLMLAGQFPLGARYVVLADRDVLKQRAQQLGLNVRLRDYAPGHDATNLETSAAETTPELEVLHCPAVAAVQPGKLDVRNSQYVLDMLNRACDGCVTGEFNAMVTAPVQKSVIADAGYPFSGHTEYLAERTHTPRVVMMLAGKTPQGGEDGWLRVALATTHLPLRDVADAITHDVLTQTLNILHADLIRKFGISSPRILVAGLNPHAGEQGHLGQEEIGVITPVCDALRAQGMRIEGPLPADTLFVAHHLRHADAVLAMYHDQGLPVLKHATFGQGSNVTLGLPIIRTSVDHGTALDLAGTGRADAGSMMTAIQAALGMALRQF